jgi:hypothetical protein
MKTKNIRKILKTALKNGKALKIKQRYDSLMRYGYPVGMADDWVVFHRITTGVMTLNGYMAVRVQDIEGVRTDTDFLMRALSALGESPMMQPDVVLTDLPQLLQSANERFPLLTVHLEAKWPDRLFVGRVDKIGKNAVHLLEIRSDAHWRRSISKYRYKDITQVAFGDGYVNALWMLGQQEWLARQESQQDGRNST